MHYFYLLILFLVFSSCGKFNHSPFSAKVEKLEYNTSGGTAIGINESKFGTTFKVPIISDSHDYYDEFESAVQTVNPKSGEYPFFVLLGDFTDLGLKDEYLTTIKFLKKLRMPFLTVVGNHDLLNNGKIIFERLFGAFNYSLEYKQTLFLFFNNNNYETEGGAPDFNWLESQLAAATATNIILLAHINPGNGTLFSSEQITKMKSLVNTYNVDYFINGDDHDYGVGAFGNATQVTAGTLQYKTYVELTISNGGVTHQNISF